MILIFVVFEYLTEKWFWKSAEVIKRSSDWGYLVLKEGLCM